MYLTVKSTTYANILQNDLPPLEQWEQDWSMEFNSDKCEVLRITRKRNPVIFPHKLHKKELNVTNAAKYLGVTISKDLNWTPHINNITGKAKNTLRFVKRNIKTSNKNGGICLHLQDCKHSSQAGIAYKYIRGLKKPFTLRNRTIKDAQDRPIDDTDEIKERWRGYTESVYTKDQTIQAEWLAIPSTVVDPVPAVLPAEVTKTIRHINNNKSTRF